MIRGASIRGQLAAAALPVSAGTTITLTQAVWAWTGHPLTLTQQITLILKPWAWTGQPITVTGSTVITLVSKTWQWLGQPVTVIAPTVITLAQAAWRWLTSPLGITGGGGGQSDDGDRNINHGNVIRHLLSNVFGNAR